MSKLSLDKVIASMPPDEQEAFLAWWKKVPSEVVQSAAAGFGWQALIASAWKERATLIPPRTENFKAGDTVWYHPHGLDNIGYSAVVVGNSRYLGQSECVRLEQVERAYALHCHQGKERSTVAAAALSNIRYRQKL